MPIVIAILFIFTPTIFSQDAQQIIARNYENYNPYAGNQNRQTSIPHYVQAPPENFQVQYANAPKQIQHALFPGGEVTFFSPESVVSLHQNFALPVLGDQLFQVSALEASEDSFGNLEVKVLSGGLTRINLKEEHTSSFWSSVGNVFGNTPVGNFFSGISMGNSVGSTVVDIGYLGVSSGSLAAPTENSFGTIGARADEEGLKLGGAVEAALAQIGRISIKELRLPGAQSLEVNSFVNIGAGGGLIGALNAYKSEEDGRIYFQVGFDALVGIDLEFSLGGQRTQQEFLEHYGLENYTTPEGNPANTVREITQRNYNHAGVAPQRRRFLEQKNERINRRNIRHAGVHPINLSYVPQNNSRTGTGGTYFAQDRRWVLKHQTWETIEKIAQEIAAQKALENSGENNIGSNTNRDRVSPGSNRTQRSPNRNTTRRSKAKKTPRRSSLQGGRFVFQK